MKADTITIFSFDRLWENKEPSISSSTCILPESFGEAWYFGGKAEFTLDTAF